MDEELYRRGLRIREQMWGPEAGQVKMDNATEFQRDFEELVSTYCFGAVWGREGLSLAERSMLTLGIMIALGRSQELAIHVEGAVSNGLTRDQIKEILLHAAPYCGIPAVLGAYRVAEPVLDRLESR